MTFLKAPNRFVNHLASLGMATVTRRDSHIISRDFEFGGMQMQVMNMISGYSKGSSFNYYSFWQIFSLFSKMTRQTLYFVLVKDSDNST